MVVQGYHIMDVLVDVEKWYIHVACGVPTSVRNLRKCILFLPLWCLGKKQHACGAAAGNVQAQNSRRKGCFVVSVRPSVGVGRLL